MHYKTKESAVKKYGHLAADPDALRKAIAEDDNRYDEAECNEIFEAITKPAAAGKTANPANAKVKAPAGPNAELAEKLKEFDYDELRGDSFNKYCLLVQSLQTDKLYDFEQYLVEPIKKVRYRGVKDSPVDTIGFKVKNVKPVNTTRIPVKHALQTNGLLKEVEGEYELVNDQFSHNGRYFLLKK